MFTISLWRKGSQSHNMTQPPQGQGWWNSEPWWVILEMPVVIAEKMEAREQERRRGRVADEGQAASEWGQKGKERILSCNLPEQPHRKHWRALHRKGGLGVWRDGREGEQGCWLRQQVLEKGETMCALSRALAYWQDGRKEFVRVGLQARGRPVGETLRSRDQVHLSA